MATPTPEQGAGRWVQGLQGATERMRQGAEAVTQSPGALAARRRQEWLARLQASQEKWAKNVSRVTADEWRRAYVEKGLPRVASGAQAAQGKYADFAQRFYPVASQVSQEVKAMPKLTEEDALNRVRHVIRRFRQFSEGTGR